MSDVSEQEGLSARPSESGSILAQPASGSLPPSWPPARGP